MELLRCILKRRSIRSYKSSPVPKEKIEQLLHAAVMAPSAHNHQPWNFTIVQDKILIKELSDTVKKNHLFLAEEKTLSIISKREEDLIFYNAPCLIFISAEENSMAGLNIGHASQNIQLRAYELGLGSCYVAFAQALNADPQIKERLGITKNIFGAICIGYPLKEEELIVPSRIPKVNWI